MEITNVFYKGKWYEVGEYIWFFPFQKWQIIDVIDKNHVLIERGKKLKKIEAKVRIHSI